jgi:hypothetical protein
VMYMAKAWVSMLGAVLTALTAALSDDAFNVNDATQVAMTAVAAIITLVATYAVPNRPQQPRV